MVGVMCGWERINKRQGRGTKDEAMRKRGTTHLMLDPSHALRDGHQICRHPETKCTHLVRYVIPATVEPKRMGTIAHLDLHPSARTRMPPGLGTQRMWLTSRLVHYWSPGSLCRSADTGES